MGQSERKKSPRAPSLALAESVERALKIYEKERCHAAPTDVIAQNLGYKSANNGAALSVIASLRSYGLLEKAEEGKLAVSRDIETYRFASSEDLKENLLKKWLTAPSIFSELLDQYADGLPSDASLRFDLIHRGFAPASAESTLNVLKKSVEFTNFFGPAAQLKMEENLTSDQTESQVPDDRRTEQAHKTASEDYDRIPVRLAGGRRAWLEIPTPFYAADKKRLNAQIALLLTEDEESQEAQIDL